jgi:hypothetical protein
MVSNKTRYGFGGTVETNSVGTGFWVRTLLPRRSDDVIIQISPEEALRPSLVTFKLYGKDNMLWLLFQYNNIIDPIEEIFPGRYMVLPHPSRVK